MNRLWLLLLVAILTLSGISLSATPARAAGPLATAVVHELEAGGVPWIVTGGTATTATVASPKSSGTGALQVTYDLTTASQVQLGLKTGPGDLAGLPRSLSVDVYGDGSWNVLYVQVRDATGEIFHYRVGNISHTGWKTMTTELGSTAPAAILAGDGDGLLDLPIHLFKLVIDRNPGALDLTSTITLDKVSYAYEAWSPLRPDTKIFYPALGQATTARVGLAEAGAFAVKFVDEAARTRDWTGSASGGATDAVFRWNGRDNGGAAMTGSVRARLTVTRGAVVWRYEIPYFAGIPARPEAAIPGSVAGINSTMAQVTPARRADAENQARLIEGAWLRTAREGFDWNRVEPRKGWFDWAVFDQAVEVARAHNVSLVGMLGYSASWASSAPSSAPAADRQFYPPANVADYAAYARAVVHRYKDRVHVWEIWNEPNLATFWKPAPNAAAYTNLLKAAYAAIRAEDPTATVLVGGLAASELAFMKGIAAAGGWSSFDAMAIHVYVAPQPEQSMIPVWLDNTAAYVRSMGAKPIWITELGWSTYTGSGSGYIGVSEARQAEYLARAYLLAASRGVRGVMAYGLMELGTSATSKLYNYGIVEAGGRQKPAYGALRRVAEALDQGTTAGIVDPGAASRKTASAMDTASGWVARPLGGGTARVSTSTSRHAGSGSVRLDYSFTSTSTGVELARNLALPGSPTSVGVWVHGDGSANPVYMKVRDATGEVFQAAVGSLGNSWQRLTMYADGADLNWSHSGGDNDGRFDYPLTLQSLFVFRGGIGKLSGTAYFDDLQVDTGPRERGVVISRRNGLVQSVYSLGGTVSMSLPVTSGNAWIVNGSSSTRLTPSGGYVTVSAGAMPINVLSAAGITSPTFTPGSGTGKITWLSGDRARATFQVISVHTGAVVRHVWIDRWFDAGLQTASWDGLVGGAPAPAGGYRLRVANIGPDGRVSYVFGTVTIP
jgi:hypothetical protein